MDAHDVRQDSFLLKLPRAENGLPHAGNVVIRERLGRGGMGAVYLGFDEKLAIEVAVKVLPFEAAETPEAVGRFVREARSTVRIDHPNLVRVFTVDEEAGTHYLVMEYVDGDSAAGRIEREGPLPERDALEIAIAAGEALAAAHAEGILHRDVKPANIMVRFKDGRVKVADLGLAKAVGGEGGETTGLTATGAMLGTPAYMSPEQAEDASRADGRTDIYSLGATLYALLSGRAPFQATQLLKLLLDVTREKPKDLRKLRPDVREETAGAVKKLMAKKPAERPQTMTEAVELLRGCLEAAPPEGARGLARPQMAGRRKVVVEEPTPTPAAPRARTLDDVTPSQVRRRRVPTRRAEAPVVARLGGGKKLAIILGILAALGAAGGSAAYLYSQKRAADARLAEVERTREEKAAEERRREEGARKKREEARAAAEVKKREADARRTEEERKLKAADAQTASHLKAARSFQEAGLFEQARDEAAEALKILPDHIEAKRLLADIQAEIATKQSEAGRAAEYRKWMDEGLRLRLAGKLQEAATAYERAQASAPAGSTSAAEAAADCLAEHFKSQAVDAEARGDHEKAVAFYAQALTKKDDARIRAALTAAKKKLDAKRAEEARKAEAARWRARATEAETRGDLKSALGYYREAEKLGADVGKKVSSLEALHQYHEAMERARSHMRKQDWSSAKRELEKALAQEPGDREATRLIAEAQRRSSARPRRMPIYGKVIAVRPEAKLVMLSVGSDDGVRPGDRFTISRDETYVGKLEVVRPFNDMTSAGILLPWTKGVIKEGDNASLIVGDDGPAHPAGMQPAPPVLTIDLGGGVKMEMVYIKPGRFMMGSEQGEPDEKPAHEVGITRGFYLGKYEVTQEQYERVMGTNPSRLKGARNPVEQVSWNAAAEFCRKLSQQTGRSFRLPTEAEWEYACRAGSTGKYCFGSDEGRLGEYAWYSRNSGGQTHSVGQKRPNVWGLYDMHGNIWEWCADWYDGGYYAKSPREDPKGPATGKDRVLRGRSWRDTPYCCRSADRHWGHPTARHDLIGFRVALSFAPGK